jgi:hypothetical protein
MTNRDPSINGTSPNRAGCDEHTDIWIGAHIGQRVANHRHAATRAQNSQARVRIEVNTASGEQLTGKGGRAHEDEVDVECVQIQRRHGIGHDLGSTVAAQEIKGDAGHDQTSSTRRLA